MRRALSTALFISLLLSALNLAAQELSERDAVEKALAYSRELATLASEVQQREKEATAAGLLAFQNPELRMQDISTKYGDGSANQEFQIGLRWQPPKIGELAAATGREQVRLWERKVALDEFRRALTARVRLAYAEAAMFGKYEESARERARLTAERATAVEKLVELGERPLMDKIKGRKRVLDAVKDAAVAVRKSHEARQRLAQLTGVAGAVAGDPAGPPVLTTDRKRLKDIAAAMRPEVELARQESAWYGSRSRADRSAMIPWFSFVELGYHYESDKPDSGELSLGIEIPIFNWMAGDRFAAQASPQYDTLKRDAAAALIERDIADALTGYEEALAAWRAVETDTGKALASFATLLAEAQMQALPADEVLELELTAVELRMTLLETAYDLTEAAIELCAAVGVDDFARLTDGPEGVHE